MNRINWHLEGRCQTVQVDFWLMENDGCDPQVEYVSCDGCEVDLSSEEDKALRQHLAEWGMA
jgi:hypothetical protein